MTIAALYDIHGNRPALDAVLAELRDARVDTIALGGDVVLGPMPRETIERVMALDVPAIAVRGNCDRLVVSAFDGDPLDALPPALRDRFAWCAAQLDRAHRDWLAALPLTRTVDDVLFCHATPRSDEEILNARTPDADAAAMLGGVSQRVMVCGHTHLRMDRTVGSVRVVNPGSLGMPFDAPGAHWMLLDGADVRAITTAYDGDAAASAIRATGYPGAEQFLTVLER